MADTTSVNIMESDDPNETDKLHLSMVIDGKDVLVTVSSFGDDLGVAFKALAYLGQPKILLDMVENVTTEYEKMYGPDGD